MGLLRAFGSTRPLPRQGATRLSNELRPATPPLTSACPRLWPAKMRTPMNTENHTSPPSTPDLQAALAECEQRWAKGLFIDPLGFPQFHDTVHTVNAQNAPPVEAELVTRPKTGGGTRLEVVPDCVTSLRLQLVARRLRDRVLPSTYSVISSQSPGSQQYALWSDTIPLWIRHRLVGGNTVLVADIEDYFGSVPTPLIKTALNCAGLDGATIGGVSDTIQAINSIPDHTGATRRGIPVSQDDLFWYVADLVLRPVDKLLAQHAGIGRHLRWVDDFFIAVESTDAVDHALRVLTAALAPIGLHLNLAKTRVFDSLPQYDHQSLAHQHRTVNSLLLTSERAPLSRSQHRVFAKLTEMDRVQSTEHSRLWKRIYALATRLRSSALVSEAVNDLTLFPTAEAQISSYLEAVHWPSGTFTEAARLLLRRSTTDTQAINLLQALLASPPPVEAQALCALRDLADSSPDNHHPYTLSLANACLVHLVPTEQYAATTRLFSLSTNPTSPRARRLAIQLLWLMPEYRETLAPQIARDPSHAVRSLADLPAVASSSSDAGTHRTIPKVPPSAAVPTRITEAFLCE